MERVTANEIRQRRLHKRIISCSGSSRSATRQLVRGPERFRPLTKGTVSQPSRVKMCTRCSWYNRACPTWEKKKYGFDCVSLIHATISTKSHATQNGCHYAYFCGNRYSANRNTESTVGSSFPASLQFLTTLHFCTRTAESQGDTCATGTNLAWRVLAWTCILENRRRFTGPLISSIKTR